MTGLGPLHYFLGLYIWNMVDAILLSYNKYVTNLLSQFHISDCNPSPASFKSSVKVNVNSDSPLVDATLYH